MSEQIKTNRIPKTIQEYRLAQSDYQDIFIREITQATRELQGMGLVVEVQYVPTPAGSRHKALLIGRK